MFELKSTKKVLQDREAWTNACRVRSGRDSISQTTGSHPCVGRNTCTGNGLQQVINFMKVGSAVNNNGGGDGVGCW